MTQRDLKELCSKVCSEFLAPSRSHRQRLEKCRPRVQMKFLGLRISQLRLDTGKQNLLRSNMYSPLPPLFYTFPEKKNTNTSGMASQLGRMGRLGAGMETSFSAVLSLLQVNMSGAEEQPHPGSVRDEPLPVVPKRLDEASGAMIQWWVRSQKLTQLLCQAFGVDDSEPKGPHHMGQSLFESLRA